jgi:hypothetical protein
MRTSVCFLALVVLASCEREPEKITPTSDAPVKPSWADEAAKPRISRERAIEIANAVITEKKINATRFAAPHIDFIERTKTWQFAYDMKPPTVKGGKFTITIDEEGKGTFISGY